MQGARHQIYHSRNGQHINKNGDPQYSYADEQQYYDQEQFRKKSQQFDVPRGPYQGEESEFNYQNGQNQRGVQDPNGTNAQPAGQVQSKNSSSGILRPLISFVLVFAVLLLLICIRETTLVDKFAGKFRPYWTGRVLELDLALKAEMKVNQPLLWVPNPSGDGGWNITNETWHLLLCDADVPSEMCACLLDNTVGNSTYNSTEHENTTRMCLLYYTPTMVIGETDASWLSEPYYYMIGAVLLALTGRLFSDYISWKSWNNLDDMTQTVQMMIPSYGVAMLALSFIFAGFGAGWYTTIYGLVVWPVIVVAILIGAVMWQHIQISIKDGASTDDKMSNEDKLMLQTFNMGLLVNSVKRVLVVLMVSLTVCMMRGWGELLHNAIVAMLLAVVCIIDVISQAVFRFHASTTNEDTASQRALETVRMFCWFVNFFVLVALWVINFPQYGDEIAHSSIGYTILLLYIATITLVSDFANEYRVLETKQIVSFRLLVDDFFIVVIGVTWAFHTQRINHEI